RQPRSPFKIASPRSCQCSAAHPASRTDWRSFGSAGHVLGCSAEVYRSTRAAERLLAFEVDFSLTDSGSSSARVREVGEAAPAIEGAVRDCGQPGMMLCTVDTCGCPGSAPNSAMIGTSVSPKASNDSWESQTSNTWICPSLSHATW